MFGSLIDRYFIKQPYLRSLVTSLLYGRRDRQVDLFGSRFVMNSVRENGYVRAARRIAYSSLLRDEMGVLLSLSSLLQPGDTFVDVGANVGLFCCTLNRINHAFPNPSVRFYAYEPHPDTFRRLQLNTAGTRIVPRKLALSDRSGEAAFVDGAVSHVFTVATQSSNYHFAGASVVVQTVRLDHEEIEGDRIIIKIDAENQEWAVLKGAERLFESGLVKAVYLDGTCDQQKVEEFLRDFGFRFFNGRSLAPSTGGDFSLLAIQR